jgi:hypothetical protein
VRGGFLYVAQRHPGVQRGGDERMPEDARPGTLADPGPAAVRKTGPSARSPMAGPAAIVVCGASVPAAADMAAGE